MDKNKKILYCILGSFILAMLNNPIFPIFDKANVLMKMNRGGYLISEMFILLSNISSLIGFVLLILFSILLIINNVKK